MNKLEICKQCELQKFDMQQGIICSLTNAKPNFEGSCQDFSKSLHSKIQRNKTSAILRPNRERASTASILVWIALAANIATLISYVMQYSLLKAVSFGEAITTEAANANDTRVQIIAIISLIIWIISGITFIMWFRRAYYNLNIISTSTNFTEGWAAGCWFVPIISLYRPYQIMKELYEDTKKYLNRNSISNELDTKLLGTWWGLWITHVILDQIANKIMDKANDIDILSTCTMMLIIDALIFIALSIVTLRIINDYAKAEKLLINKADQ